MSPENLPCLKECDTCFVDQISDHIISLRTAAIEHRLEQGNLEGKHRHISRLVHSSDSHAFAGSGLWHPGKVRGLGLCSWRGS